MPPSIPLSPSQPRGEATAAASPAVAMMQAAQRKAQQEAEERARKEAQEAAQEARSQEAMQINRDQNARAAAAAEAEQAQTKRAELARTAAGDIAVSAPAYGTQWDKTPDYVRKDFQNRYGADALADAPKQWDASLQKPEPEENTSARELAAAGGDPAGLSPADRNKAMARLRMAEREAAATAEQAQQKKAENSRLMAGDIAVSAPAFGVQWDKLPDDTRQDFANRYGHEAMAEAPKQWDSSLTKPEVEENTTPRALAAEGGDPSLYKTPAERNKAMAQLRIEQRKAAAEKERTMPASSVEKLTLAQELADLSQTMGERISTLTDDDLGPIDAGLVPKVKNFLGYDPEKDGGWLGSKNSPGFNDAMSAYNTVRNIILRARSGGAVTDGEAARLLQELGDPVNRQGTFKSDVANFVRNRRADVDVQREALKSAGYTVPEKPSAATKPEPPGQPQAPTGLPAAGEVRSGYRFKGGNPADKNNWEPVNP